MDPKNPSIVREKSFNTIIGDNRPTLLDRSAWIYKTRSFFINHSFFCVINHFVELNMNLSLVMEHFIDCLGVK